MTADQLIAALQPELTALRRDLHAHPELAFEERRTSDVVADYLTKLGLEVHRGLGGTGVVARLKAGDGSGSIGLRADTDALPLTEKNAFEHRSTHEGRMHACGHDGHMTLLLGAARVLTETRGFNGTVNFIFQPAEEGGGGGRVMVEQGVFRQFPMDAVFALHNWPGLDVGHIAMQPVPGILRGIAEPSGKFGLLVAASLAIVLVTLARGASSLGANYLLIGVGQRMVNDLRTELYAHLQKLSLSFHSKQQTGDLLYRVMSDTYSIQGMLMNGLLPLASSAVMLSAMFYVMLRLNPQLALLALVVGPPLYLSIGRLSGRIHGQALASRAAESELYARAETTIGAVKLVQAYGREERAVAVERVSLVGRETLLGPLAGSRMSLERT